jgi:hypothetical protein
MHPLFAVVSIQDRVLTLAHDPNRVLARARDRPGRAPALTRVPRTLVALAPDLVLDLRHRLLIRRLRKPISFAQPPTANRGPL